MISFGMTSQIKRGKHCEVKVVEMMTESTNKNINTGNKDATLNETNLSKNQMLYIIILYHITNTVFIHGNQKSTCLNKEFPILAGLSYNKKQNTSMTESYSKILEISSANSNPPEQQSRSTLNNYMSRETDSPETAIQINHHHQQQAKEQKCYPSNTCQNKNDPYPRSLHHDRI